MTIEMCRDCGTQVSTSALRCPQCGAQCPTTSQNVLGAVYLVAFAMFVAFMVWYWPIISSSYAAWQAAQERMG